MTMKKLLSLILVLTMLISLVACTPSDIPVEGGSETEVLTNAPESTTESEPMTEAPEASFEVSYPITVTDQTGRTVTIEKEPARLVSGYYISTSLVIALGKESNLVGIEAKAASRSIYKLSAPDLIELPNVGSAKQFDLEGCIALEPDLVILPAKLKDAAETLTSLGIPVLLVNPESQELLNEARDLIATSLNCLERAAAIDAFIAEKTAILETTLKDTTAPSVYLAGNSSMLGTAGKEMYQHTVITTAGGKNVAEEITDTYWAEVSYEQLLLWDPEYIILASDASYTVDDVLADKSLADCRAVKEGKVYKMPDTAEAWDSPVAGGVLGSIWLASVLHSDVFTAETANTIIEEFYSTFYGFSYNEA